MLDISRFCKELSRVYSQRFTAAVCTNSSYIWDLKRNRWDLNETDEKGEVFVLVVEGNPPHTPPTLNRHTDREINIQTEKHYRAPTTHWGLCNEIECMISFLTGKIPHTPLEILSIISFFLRNIGYTRLTNSTQILK
jgi:hypothetical protein